MRLEYLPGLMLYGRVSPDGALPEIDEQMRDDAAAIIGVLFDKTVRAVALCPVFGVSGDSDLVLAEGVALRRTTPLADMELLDAGVLRASFQNQMVIAQVLPDVVLEVTLDHEKSLSPPSVQHAGVHVRLERRDTVLAAISLVSEGRAAIEGVSIGYVPPALFGASIVPAATELYNLPKAVALTRIAGQLPDAYRAVEALDMHVSWGLALRRIQRSPEREYLEDRLLDLMIAAEAIFLRGDRQELGYKLAVRSAYFLEPDDPVRRRRIFATIKAAYGLRGAVAHGEPLRSTASVLGTDLPMRAFLDGVEEIVRRALQKQILETAPEQRKHLDFDGLVIGDTSSSATPESH